MKPFSSLLLGLFLGSLIIAPVQAQITIDGTTNTNLTPIDTGIRIDDGDRAGNNLFHSFEQFSIFNGSEAFFNNANDIVNIFSRVTGGNISNIDGLLRANGTANLFLLNPAGIIFGENAQLDIDGSFLSSTADSIVFSDGVKFLATDSDEPPLLTINMPIGLNLGNNLGQIVNHSLANNGRGLEVATGESITLIGGNINLEGGRLFAPGGRVELGGLSTAGEVKINADGSLVFPEGVARADVILTNGARVDVKAGGGGSISVNARNIELSRGELGRSFLLAGIAENSGSTAAQAGDIILNAEDTITVNQESAIANRVEKSGVGNAGGIDIVAANLFLTQGSIFSLVQEDAIGDSGRINITTTNLFLAQGGQIATSSFGVGNAGRITIEASDTISVDGEDQAGFNSSILSQISSNEVGNSAGVIDITTTNLHLTQGGGISATTRGKGNAGKITIEASGTISIDGENQARFSSGIFSVVTEDAIGTGGKIDITTANLYLTRGGVVTASTFGDGNAGEIAIEASDTISANGKSQNETVPSGIFSVVNESGVGNANDININTNNLFLSNEAQISVESLGQGEAGNLSIQANSLSLENRASLSASTPVRKGGNITLDIAEDLTLQDDSIVSAQALGDANGGNIEINAGFVLAFPSQNEGNDIIANAQQGRGGDIIITTQGIFGLEEGRATDNGGNRLSNGTNDIDPSSQFGLNGTITINELEANPAEGIEDLPRFVIDPDKLVVFSLCSLARDSEFYFTAKGGNTPDPVEIRDEGVIAVDLVEPVPLEEEKQGSGGAREQRRSSLEEIAEDRGEIVEAQGWIFHENGVVELVAYKTDVKGSPAQPQDPRVCSK